jgi:tetratricopeptide (TPR) repeat protein
MTRALSPRSTPDPDLRSRRAFIGAVLSVPTFSPAAIAGAAESVDELQRSLVAAYEVQDFTAALDVLARLRRLEPKELKWIEADATISTDRKDFERALKSYDVAYEIAKGDAGAEARILNGRALAREGVYDWPNALRDYDEVLRLAESNGFAPDPYVLNSRGNVRGSLNRWDDARDDYERAGDLFQNAKGFRNGASTTQRLDGAIYAYSNRALATAQLGDEGGALRQLEALTRRAPNSADVRAAAAALYYSAGRYAEAEDAWERACSREAGCAKYKDLDYVRRIRRWPPAMVGKLEKFLELKS